MAGKPKRMSQVKQILRMHKKGKSMKTIAKALSISKNTVRGYVRKAKAGNLPIEALLAMKDPVLEGKLWPGNPAYKDDRYEQLKGQLVYYSKELKKVGVTRQLLWEEYKTVGEKLLVVDSECFWRVMMHQKKDYALCCIGM